MIRAQLILMLPLILLGCLDLKREKPGMIYMPDMVYSPAFKAQEEGAHRLPVAGTIPRGFVPYQYSNDPEAAGSRLKNPLRRTASVFERGRHLFNIYCIVCHGPLGEGDGTMVPKFPRPPSLQSEKVMTWPDGRIYHMISMGQNLMPSYARQIEATDRWAIIHYLRALQRSRHPESGDL